MTPSPPYPVRPWTVHEGDMRLCLDAEDADSFDSCVTDTPYGLSTILDPPNLDREALWLKLTSGAREAPIRTLMRSWLDTGENPIVRGKGFMGKEWDALVPSPNAWRAVWRVLKPGAYLFAFGGTRTYALIELSIRLADFEVDDGICTWLQAQGMPKRVRLDLKIDQHFGKASERPVVGTRLGLPGMAKDGSNQRGGFDAMFSEEAGVPMPSDVRGPATPEAARFVGHDRALGPKWEPIIVAHKPLRGTIAENALAYGTGGLRVDACRIDRGSTRRTNHASIGYGGSSVPSYETGSDQGGYPSNVLLDEFSAARLDTMVGPCGGAAPASGPTYEGPQESVAHGRRNGQGDAPAKFHGKVQGPSEFFYVAKAATSERDKGLEALAMLTPGQRSGGREEGSAGINAYAGTRAPGRNIHPTVKSVRLMRYLVRLATPSIPGMREAWHPDPAMRPRVLDPFLGSGTTSVAALLEGLCVVGCEMSPEYATLARMRCQHAYALPREEDEVRRERESPVAGQRTLF